MDVAFSFEVDASYNLTAVSNEGAAYFMKDRNPLRFDEDWHFIQGYNHLHIRMGDFIRGDVKVFPWKPPFVLTKTWIDADTECTFVVSFPMVEHVIDHGF